jgi:hypothetical protein
MFNNWDAPLGNCLGAPAFLIYDGANKGVLEI